VASKSVGLFFMLLIDLTAIVGNAAVMTVIVKTPALRKFVFVFHLCLVDFLAALTLMPLEMLSGSAVFHSRGCSLQWSRGPYCKFFVVFFAAFYFLLPLLIIVVVYCSMFKVAASLRAGPSRSTMVTTSGAPRTTPQRTFGGGKAAAILLAVGGQFLFCWLPYFSFHLYTALSAQPLVGPAAETVVTWLGYFCFTSN
ncbi:PREDICTED: LOW QUALITY PROTEIN: probable G-protein coupled receptor 61, partial [Phaethon lepturus]|uniref:LOW QUALITY PROTEIN: probable G-protein coupled receptor 61 n=1 Tax=Phaethon lepturus TaxID=97097 RepID=UPI0005308438